MLNSEKESRETWPKEPKAKGDRGSWLESFEMLTAFWNVKELKFKGNAEKTTCSLLKLEEMLGRFVTKRGDFKLEEKLGHILMTFSQNTPPPHTHILIFFQIQKGGKIGFYFLQMFFFCFQTALEIGGGWARKQTSCGRCQSHHSVHDGSELRCYGDVNSLGQRLSVCPVSVQHLSQWGPES